TGGLPPSTAIHVSSWDGSEWQPTTLSVAESLQTLVGGSATVFPVNIAAPSEDARALSVTYVSGSQSGAALFLPSGSSLNPGPMAAGPLYLVQRLASEVWALGGSGRQAF